jgi:integrase
MARPNLDVRIWKVQDRRNSPKYQSRPWVTRWRVGDRRFQRTFRTRAEADHLRSELLVAQRNGEAFDPSTGEPSSWRATGEVAAHDWVRRWIAEQWDEWQPRTRTGTVEEMSRFVPLLVKPSAPSPPADVRLYLKEALRPGARQDERIERWMGRWCYSLQELDRSILAEVDRQLGIGVQGGVLSATTALRYRKAARACIRRAVDLDLIERDPWPPPMRGAKNRKVRRKARSRAIDIKRLPDPATMQQALDAMLNQHPASRLYHVMTSVMAYGGLRPSEVVMLRRRALVLPETGWGAIEVTEADIDFDVSGDPKTGDRTVPVPADLVALLQAWLEAGDFADDELIFRSRNGNRPSGSNWRRAWRLALAKIDHPLLRPYDCRHFAATTWLHAGVPLGETARRLGHSVETLVSTYVGALKGDETASNDLIDRYRDQSLDSSQ